MDLKIRSFRFFQNHQWAGGPWSGLPADVRIGTGPPPPCLAVVPAEVVGHRVAEKLHIMERICLGANSVWKMLTK